MNKFVESIIGGYLTLDELIEDLQQAKEHCVDGRSEVIIHKNQTHTFGYIDNVEFDNDNVTININIL